MIEVHTVKEPFWVKALVEDVVTEAITPYGFIGTVGYRYWEPEQAGNNFDGWQLVIFPTANEVRGPVPHDGCKFVSGFSLDLAKIMAVMASVDHLAWNNPVQYNGDLDGPEISMKGHFAGRRVWLRFFHLPPPDEPCSFFVNPRTGVATEKSA